MNTKLSAALDRVRGRLTAKPFDRRTTTLPSGHALSLRLGDITEESIDAIVNAANEGLVLGGGVSGAIYRKGGYDIQDECDRIGRTRTGNAAITGAGKLPARYVIHAVGPMWSGRDAIENDRLLAATTTASLEIARQRGLRSIAFPAISSGIFGFPKHRCASVMLSAICEWAAQHPAAIPNDLRITIIDQETLDFFETEFDRIFK